MSAGDEHGPGDVPAPPSMHSPYGMPLNGGEGSGFGGPNGPGGPRGPEGPGGPDRRHRTLMISALAVVAVVGIGGAAAAFAGGGDSTKNSSTAMAQAESSSSSTDGGDFPGAAISATSSGKPNGDTLPGGPVVSSADIPGGPGARSASPAAAPATTGKTTGATPSKSATAAPPKPSTAPKPSTPASSAPKTTAPPPPSTDCTYLNVPAKQMPTIQKGSTDTNAIKQMQCLLKKSMLGIKPLAIDGVWGTDTQSALTGFQSCNNAPTVKSPGGTPPYPKLELDGVAGPQTWADLYFWDNQYFNNVAYYCNGTR